MYNRGETYTVLRFIAGFCKETSSEDARTPAKGYTSCFESSQMRADFSYWFGKKFDNIRIGPSASIRIKIRSQNTHIGSHGWSGESNGIRLF
jgi:hypothetical protein